MVNVTVTQKLLFLLAAIKGKQNLALNEAIFAGDRMWENKPDESGRKRGWIDEVRDYFYAIPKDLMEEVGLPRTEYCLTGIMYFEIPEEWQKVGATELNEFTLSF